MRVGAYSSILSEALILAGVVLFMVSAAIGGWLIGPAGAISVTVGATVLTACIFIGERALNDEAGWPPAASLAEVSRRDER